MTSPLLTSLAVPHAFTTRHTGVSRGIFDSLNFGNPSDLTPEHRDPSANIRANFQLVLSHLDSADREIVEVHQVHGAATHTVRAGQASHAGPRDTKADALITDDPARLLVIRVADCAPILLASHDGRVVAAAHAGWRGVIAGIIPATVRAMHDLSATEISAAIGPCISVDHFEVGPEVAAEFERVLGCGTPTIRPRDGARPTVDLKLAIRLQLEAAGVASIDTLPHCTVRDTDLFFSHRREQGRTGRMIGLIGPRSRPANNPRP